MSASAHNGADDIAFYEADIGYTYELSVTDAGAQLDEALGALPSGRYLIQAQGLEEGDVCWVHFGPYRKPIPLSVGSGPKRIPLTSAIFAFETHIRKGNSDTLGAITTSGASAILWITLVSVKSGNN